jgi:hypothetical protein
MRAGLTLHAGFINQLDSEVSCDPIYKEVSCHRNPDSAAMMLKGLVSKMDCIQCGKTVQIEKDYNNEEGKHSSSIVSDM